MRGRVLGFKNRVSSSWGGILVLFLPAFLCLFVASLFLLDVMRMARVQNQAQTTADMALLSSLNLRASALKALANRWAALGAMVASRDGDAVYIPTSQWPAAQAKAEELKRALPGYKGRIKAVLKVAMEANGIRNDALTLQNDQAFDLGVTPESCRVIGDNGEETRMDGIWYRRTWAPEERLAQPVKTAMVATTLTLPLLGPSRNPNYKAVAQSRGGLIWEVDEENATVQADGNGGFPRNWEEAWDGSSFSPYRWPQFMGGLKEEGNES